MLNVLDKVDINIDSDGNPLLEGGYAPVDREIEATDLEVIGEVPKDVNGIYVRNGPNPLRQPRGRYHIFDGDGMLHSATINNGNVTYRNRWIRTTGFEMEAKAGESIWPGLMEMPDRNLPVAWGSDHWLKDNSNTAVVPFNGKLLTTFYQCGEPYLVNASTLETEGTIGVDALQIRQVMAHSRSDLKTGEFIFFDYDTKPPYMTYGVLAPDGSLKHFTEVDLPGARLPHDMAITENYSILHDLPLFWDPILMQREVHKVTFYPDIPSRFGIIPRYGSNADIKWFEASPTYIYHVINAWEEGDEVIMDACRINTPAPSEEELRGGPLQSLIAWSRLDPYYYRWRFNLKTGKTKEEQLDDRYTEFPMINMGYQGYKSRYSYHVDIAQGEPLRMSGIVKHDSETGKKDIWEYGENVYASEAPFAPRLNSQSEDDGYVLTFVEDMNDGGKSELHIFDATSIVQGPIARVKIPQRVPQGFHSCWMPGEFVA